LRNQKRYLRSNLRCAKEARWKKGLGTVARIIPSERSMKLEKFLRSIETEAEGSFLKRNTDVLKDMICRGLLLQLEARGFIKFLPRQKNPLNPPSGRQELDRLSYLGVRVYWRCSHLDCFGQSEGQGDQDRPLRSLC
jgi:hypothetical protein